MNHVRSKADIYAGVSIIFDDEDEVYRCPVCAKEYRSQQAAHRHLSRQRCHSVASHFQHTHLEQAIYNLYVDICVVNDIQHAASLPTFRPRKEYEAIATFFLFCIENGVRDPTQYAEYAMARDNDKNAYHALAIAQKKSSLLTYRKFLVQNPNFIPSERYFDENETQLKSDLGFVCQSVEMANIALGFLFAKMDINNLYQTATTMERLRFDAVANTLGMQRVIRSRH